MSSQTGAICLDILKDNWTPALTLQTALISLRALLAAPEASDPQDAQVASQYIGDRAAFEAQALAWTVRFAGGSKPEGSSSGAAAPAPGPAPAPPSDPRVRTITDMGFSVEQAEAALGRNGGNVEAAVEALLGSM